jgi:NADPH:quinone reductase-like Zn-dependent oxidoreductase
MSEDTMTALRAHHRGGSEQLHTETAPIPEPRHNELLVKVRAVGITFAELSWDETWTRDGQSRLPIVPGHEMCGTVTSVGVGVQQFHLGDEVFGLVPFDEDGAAATYVRTPAASVAIRPSALAITDAAALPLAGLTAWQALVDHGSLAARERVLVHGGAGAVGSMAVQLAARLGADVTSTVRPADAEFVMSLGANAVVDMDHFDAEPGVFDVVIDTLGGDISLRSMSTLRAGGRLICLSAPPPPTERFDISATFFIVKPVPSVLSELARLVIANELEVPIARVYPLSQGREAYASGDLQPRSPGKTVLDVAGS